MQRLQQLQQHTPAPNWLFNFLLLSWLHQLWLTHGFFVVAQPAAHWDMATLFHLTAWLFYSLLYLLPVALIGAGIRLLTHFDHGLKIAAVYIASVVVLLLLRVDLLIYDLYSFHFNSFVWNLILTPGGITSLGSSDSTTLSAVLLLLRVMAVQAAALWISRRGLLLHGRRRHGFRWATALGASLFLLQGTVYGISDLQHYGPVLDGSNAYPLFQRVRFRSLAMRLGYAFVEQPDGPHLQQAQAALRYPLMPVSYTNTATPPNIVVLVAESLRWDQLSPETMPNSWQFGQQNSLFTRHYSSGNGTREALFGMFYGLYGSYWEKFLHARQSPLLMDRLQQLGYQLDIRTSATFSYPEFNKTLFVNVPPAALHEAGDKLPPWQRDRDNMDALLQFLQQRDPARPFMEFFFLESSHASYSFPEANALHTDYQRDIDYLKLKKTGLADSADPLLKRYRNSAHWIDEQLGRLYAALEQQGLLDSTIVIVTGDHGEEFMEKGAWGHNSSFVEEQVHVPLIVHVPGRAPAVIASLTSHLDIPTTLLQNLGINAPVQNYSLGRNLFDQSARDHLVLSDWHSIGLLTPRLKLRIPYLQQRIEQWPPTDTADQALSQADADTLVQQEQPLILEAMRNFSLFTPAGRQDVPGL